MPFSTSKRFQVAVALGALVLGACESAETEPAAPTVSSAYAELAAAAAECGQTAGECMQNAQGDRAAVQACRDELEGCRADAGAAADHALADAIKACVDTAGDCRSNTDAGARQCAKELRACLGETRQQHDDADAAAGASNDAPGAQCVDELKACVSSGATAATCARAMRECVLSAVPVPDGVTPGDGHGASKPDHLPPEHPDAGSNDHQPPARDAGRSDDHPQPPVDAGRPDDVPATPDAAMAHDDATDCKAEFDACVAAGGKRQSCTQAQRECARQNP